MPDSQLNSFNTIETNLSYQQEETDVSLASESDNFGNMKLLILLHCEHLVNDKLYKELFTRHLRNWEIKIVKTVPGKAVLSTRIIYYLIVDLNVVYTLGNSLGLSIWQPNF